MAQYNYIGSEGIVVQDLEEIKADLISQFKSIYGTNINLEQNSPDGQWLNILAQEKKDILDFIVQIYNNLDVDAAVGLPQQILYKLNGIQIKNYKYSYCYVNVTVNQDVSLAGLDADAESPTGTGFTVADTNGNNWLLLDSVDLTANTTTLLNFRSMDAGAIISDASTITVPITIIPGVTTINNPNKNYITGQTGETAAQFRQRRLRTIAVASQGFDESIEAQMLSLTNVVQCKVYDNRTNSTVDGIPAHSVWVIVGGGASSEIARVIYNNIPPGIGMKGDVEGSVVSSNGTIKTVNWDVPTSVTLYVKMTIAQFTDDESDIDKQHIAQQLADMQYEIGERVESAQITTVVKDILRQVGTVYDVALSLTREEDSWVDYIEPSGLDEYFALDVVLSDIIVVSS